MNPPNTHVRITETETEEIDIDSADAEHGTPQGDTAPGDPGGPGHGTPQTVRRS